MAPEMLLMSKKIYDTLSPEDQKIFRDAAKDSVPYMRKLWDEKELKSRALVEAGGAKIVRSRQEVVPGCDEAGLRKVHHRSEAEGHGDEDPGDPVDPRGGAGDRRRRHFPAARCIATGPATPCRAKPCAH